MEQKNQIQKDFGSIGCFHDKYRVYKPSKFDQAGVMGWKFTVECIVCGKRVNVTDSELTKEIYVYDW